MATERNTEELTKELLIEANYHKNSIEYQKSEDLQIQSLISSKKNKLPGKGMVEFIVKLSPFDLLIIECKKDLHKHTEPSIGSVEKIDVEEIENLSGEITEKYAEHGVLHYMKDLSKKYNVIGLAISGVDKANHKLTTFKIQKGGKSIKRINEAKTILNTQDYKDILNNKKKQEKEDIEIKIEKNMPAIHDYLRDRMGAGIKEKPILVSSILLALHGNFNDNWKTFNTSESLINNLIQSIEKRLTQEEIPKDKVKSMVSTFSNFLDKYKKNSHIFGLVAHLAEVFEDFKGASVNFDLAGSFYNEFLKYTGGDKQDLGIVLTPKHITEFFSEILEIDKDSVVLDPCTGTAGFLISCMKRMIELIESEDGKESEKTKEKVKLIKSKQLIGVEQSDEMFILGCSNMMFKNDGKSNMFHIDFFKINEDNHETVKQFLENQDFSKLTSDSMGRVYANISLKFPNFSIEDFEGGIAYHKIKNVLKPNKIVMNPPYSAKDKNASELNFIRHGLSLLSPKGQLAAIIPVSCAVEDNADTVATKEQILSKNRLLGVMSMPNQLFPGVGTVTCIMTFEAGAPHTPQDSVFFGNFKDDKFKLSKNSRKPLKKLYKTINDDGVEKEELKTAWDEEVLPLWKRCYQDGVKRGGRNIPGLCINATNISSKSEWLAEAYLEADYSNSLNHENKSKFIENIKKYNTYLYNSELLTELSVDAYKKEEAGIRDIHCFRYSDVFDIIKPLAKNTYKVADLDLVDGDSNIVSATEINNGISSKAKIDELNEGNVITVAANGSVGEAFYQLEPFGSTSDINILKLKNKDLNPILSMYLVTMIKEEKFKYNYGRKWGKNRMQHSLIGLPIKPDVDKENLNKILKPLDIKNVRNVREWLDNVKSVNTTRFNEVCGFIELELGKISDKSKKASENNKKASGNNKKVKTITTEKDYKNLASLVEGIKSLCVNESIDYEYIENYIMNLPHTKKIAEFYFKNNKINSAKTSSRISL